MANEKLSGKDLNLYRNAGTPESPDWQLIACLTETSLAGETEVLEANSKCGADSAPGITSWTSDFTGYAATNLAADTESSDNMISLFQNQTQSEWIITDDPVSPNVWRQFEGFISSYTEDYNFSEAVGFSGTLTIRGLVDTSLPIT